jgi:uncharacterized protein HemX
MDIAGKIALAVALIALAVGGIVISSMVQDQHRRQQQHQDACAGVTTDPNGVVSAASAFPTDCP